MKFEVALPLCAALIAFVVSVGFAGIYVYAADERGEEQSDIIAERLVRTIRPDLVSGDIDQVRQTVERFAADRVVLLDMDGNLIAGNNDPVILNKGEVYPVTNAGVPIAHLVSLRLSSGALPMPLAALLAAILLVTAIAFAVTNYFAKVTAIQALSIIETVERVSQGLSSRSSKSLIFEEFRNLRAATFKAIHKLRAENTRLTNAAYTDERTGLGNSLSLTRELTETISNSAFEDPSAYILIDADAIQQISESADSALGSASYVSMSRRVAEFVASRERAQALPPGSWKVFALQSDEFAILVDGLGARPEIMRLVRELIDTLNAPYDLSGKKFRVPASVGIVMIPEDGQSPADIRKRAESALFQARRSDNTAFQFYSPKFDRQDAARKRLEAEVRAAVENKRFIPVFQPKIDLRTGRIVGAEALARWKLESGRIVSPNVFIPVAEATGLIADIGAQIARQSCRAAARWHRLGHTGVSVAINVSPLQFETDDLGSMFISAMSEAGLPPKLLQLEITESVAVTDPERLKDVIGPLKSMGVKLAIDDFGTGHSNLAMLGRLPFDVFKIDRQFISGLYTDKQAPAIVEMILGMAETLGMETVAEGVESEAQEAFLRRRGCDQYQGFYYSPPVTLDKFILMLDEDRAKNTAAAS
ncbi:bifunctional diguanylate cyclase/phosphodiesterase [Henriciella sp. AS95]|uniref:putative bifunctional diguanylate cyclase/phosphodiesterase n=1 Tax=Henriciella sp. AS95 TaxID=3135782 RepID=UPI00316DC216